MPKTKKRSESLKRLDCVLGQAASMQKRASEPKTSPSGGLIVDAHLRLDRLSTQLSWTREDFFWILDTLRILAPTSASICSRVTELLLSCPERSLSDASARVVNSCADLLWLHRSNSAVLEKILFLVRRLQKLNLRCFDDMRLLSGIVAALEADTKSTVIIACVVIAAFCREPGNAGVINKLFAAGCLEKLVRVTEAEIAPKAASNRRRGVVVGVAVEGRNAHEITTYLAFLLDAIEALVSHHDPSLRLIKIHKTEKRTAVLVLLEAFNKSKDSPVAAAAISHIALKFSALDPSILTDLKLVEVGDSINVNLGKGVRLERFNTFADALADIMTRHRETPDVILPACEALVSLSEVEVDVAKLKNALVMVERIEKSQIHPVSERLKGILPPIQKPPLQYPASPRWVGRARAVVTKLSALIAKLTIRQKEKEALEAVKVSESEAAEFEELDEEVVEEAVRGTFEEILVESETKLNDVSLFTDEKSNVSMNIELEVSGEKFPLLAKALSIEPKEFKDKVSSRLSWKPRMVETPSEQIRPALGTLSMRVAT